MNPLTYLRRSIIASLVVLLAQPALRAAAILTSTPDLTQPGVADRVKFNQIPNLAPYAQTYNLGPTGLRGWISNANNNLAESNSHYQGLTTIWSRQILVTVAFAPCGTDATILKGDVIVGAMAGAATDINGPVPNFTSDARKAFGDAITAAEITGKLRLKRYRAGSGYADVTVKIGQFQPYSDTAPYNCLKSDKILTQATTKLISEMRNGGLGFFTSGERFSGAIKGLALLASVQPTHPLYSTVQTGLKNYAVALTPANLVVSLNDNGAIWHLSYINIFLSEYYLRTVQDGVADPSILAGINKYNIALARGQSRYGTYNAGGAGLTASGGLHGSVPPYGALNATSLAANLSFVLGRKALVAGNQAVNFEITDAIARGNNFYSYYVNKGTIPYGEHEPEVGNHSLNGKSQLAALFFALQGNRPTEAKYFSRISTASFHGREEGHTGTGFNYLWEGMGSNVGGPIAMAKYMAKIRWNLDLSRRTDGSFVYDGIANAADPISTTADGSYLGVSQWYDMNPTANYVLAYSLPLKRLFITGKGSFTSNEITDAESTNAIVAGGYIQACSKLSNATLISGLSQYDPVAREAAAIELARRKPLSTGPSTAEVSALIASISNGSLSADVNRRVGACAALGLLSESGAVTALTQRLYDSDRWVRAKAAKALRNCPKTAIENQLTTMMTAFTANATDPEVIDWTDPLQIGNTFLSNCLYGDADSPYPEFTYSQLSANKTLFYNTLRVGLKQPDSNPRSGVSRFAKNNLTYEDAFSLKSEILQCANFPSQADTMWSMYPRGHALTILGKFDFSEGIAAAVSSLTLQNNYGWNSIFFLDPALDILSNYGTAAASQLPALRAIATAWEVPGSYLSTALQQKLRATIQRIENPYLTYSFDSGTLQGWNNRVWNGSTWIDLAPNASTYSGTILPASVNNNLFGPLAGGVGPVGGNIDFHLNTQWLRSPQFRLNGGGALTVRLAMGISNTPNAPANQFSVPFAATFQGGWKGIALRRVSDGAFVLTRAKTGMSGSEGSTLTFTAAELASLNQTATYTLELINSDYGSWGWLTMDSVFIPGSTAVPALTYTFDDGTLQGWHNRVWNGSKWTDLVANTSSYAGTILPASGNNNLFGPLAGGVGPVGGQIDFHLNSQWLRSPEFYLNGNGDLTLQLSKGSTNTLTNPTSEGSIPYAAINGGGWKGVALRRTSDGAFVLAKARTGWPGPEAFNVTFTKAELATLNQSVPYTLELINSGNGTWGWLTMDNVSIPGTEALTYNFDNQTLQGWNNRVWNGSSWIDLAPNAATYGGVILPASPYNNLFGPLDGGAGPVGGQIDNHLNTLWLRSPAFQLNGRGDLTVQLSKGSSNTTNAPTSQLSVPFAATYGGGWKGVALRRVSDGAFVLTKAKTGWTGPEIATMTFTKAELAQLNQSMSYSLEVINSDYGNWGWLTVDNVSIPGSAVSSSASSLMRLSTTLTSTSSLAQPLTTLSAPLPWALGSIGSGMLKGSSSYSLGVFSQSGSGTLGSTQDQSSYNYQVLSGDGEITAKISSLENTGSLSRVGVMIRETLGANSPYVFMGMAGSDTYRMSHRTTPAGETVSRTSGTSQVPNTWVKLVRLGNTITASKSMDGITWTPVASETLPFAQTCYIGLNVSSGSDTILNRSQFSNLSVTP